MDSRQLFVADLMTIDPVTVAADAPVEEAARLCHVHAVSGLPVIDEAGSLVGVISQSDLVMMQDTPLSRLIRAAPSGLRVGEAMTSPAVTIPIISPLQEAARLMRDERIHRVVAVDDHGRPVGVLSGSDFVALYAEG
jgi:CBS-domain-containing membrane protein